MTGNGRPRRADLILQALLLEIERRRPVIDTDATLSKVVITVHLASGGGHPRAIQCHMDHEITLPRFEKQLTPAILSATVRSESTG